MSGYRQSIGLAISRDIDRWEKPEEWAKDGLGVAGTDCCVVRDVPGNRWLMYTCTGDVLVYQSKELLHWLQAGVTLSAADMIEERVWATPRKAPL